MRSLPNLYSNTVVGIPTMATFHSCGSATISNRPGYDSLSRWRIGYFRATVHPVAAVDPDDGGLVAIGLRIHTGSSECLGPIRGKTLDMVRMEIMAERMAHYFVGHHPTMPRKTFGPEPL